MLIGRAVRGAAALGVAVSVAAVSCAGVTRSEVDEVDDEVVDVAASQSSTTTTVPVPGCVAAMSVEQKAGQLLMVLVASPSAASDLVAEGKVAGYALVGAQSGDIAGQVAAVAARSKLPVFASGDEEGGTVQRFRDMLGALPSAQALASENTPEGAGAVFGEYGTKLASLGLNMNFGPSLDVGSGSGLGTRSFGGTVDIAADYGLAVIAAVKEAGLIPVAKHWPGIGGGDIDPHAAASPVAPLTQLRERDLIPFERAMDAGLDALMVSHAIVPDLTGDLPASLSRAAITDELRGEEGFDGLVVTDSLGMGAIAIRLDNSTAAVVSVAAGADLALVSLTGSIPAAHQGLVDAINRGDIPLDQIDRSVGRVLRAKGITGDCPL